MHVVLRRNSQLRAMESDPSLVTRSDISRVFSAVWPARLLSTSARFLASESGYAVDNLTAKLDDH